MARKTRRSENRRVNPGRRAFASGLQAPEDIPGVLASEPTSVSLCHSQRNAVGSELVTQTKVQATASGAWYPGTTRQWLSRVPSCERNSDEQFRGIAEIASAETRTRRRLAGYGHDLHARDQRRRKAYCGATWQRSLGNFGRQLDGKGKRLGSGASQAVCYQLKMVAGVRFELTTFGL